MSGLGSCDAVGFANLLVAVRCELEELVGGQALNGLVDGGGDEVFELHGMVLSGGDGG